MRMFLIGLKTLPPLVSYDNKIEYKLNININLFCVLRSKNVVPNALQVKNNLKLITVSQYLKNVSNGNCDEDDRELLSGFLDVIQKAKVCNNVPEVKITDNLAAKPHVLLLNNGELNSLYNICR